MSDLTDTVASLALTAMLAACSVSEPLPGEVAATDAASRKMEEPVDADRNVASASSEGVAGLPFSHGKSFRTLDEYLAHLERYAAPIDQPWWREIRPGVYEHVKRMPGAQRETATRAELMKRFGFSR